eukprot:13661-Heterococcus_DN1.PRE.2
MQCAQKSASSLCNICKLRTAPSCIDCCEWLVCLCTVADCALPAKGAKTVRMLCDHNVKKKQWMRHNKLRDECASQHTPRRGLRTASAAVRPTNALTNKICKVQEIELGATKQTYPIMCHVTDHVTVCPLLTAVTAAVASSSLFAASLCLISISIVIIRVYELMTNATVTTAVVT